MPLIKPALVHADPGRPVTAQAWNALVDAIGALYDAVDALGGHAVAIDVGDGSGTRSDARIVALPATGGRAIAAIAPFPGQTAHQLAGLTAGDWQLHVSAPGCADANVTITVPVAAPVTVTLTPNQQRMPDLFGRTLTQALAALATPGFAVEAVLNVTGTSIPKINPPAQHQNAVVLAQMPPAGSWVAAASAQVRLIVSAEMESSIVTVPNLAGLTLAEATRALAAVGLEIGSTSVT